jgi:hypothetical protein
MMDFAKEAAIIIVAVAMLCGLIIGTINATSAVFSPGNAFLVSVAIVAATIFIAIAAALRASK